MKEKQRQRQQWLLNYMRQFLSDKKMFRLQGWSASLPRELQHRTGSPSSWLLLALVY